MELVIILLIYSSVEFVHVEKPWNFSFRHRWLLKIFADRVSNFHTHSHVCIGLFWGDPGDKILYVFIEIPYILESNPHPFYSFRGL